MLRSLAEEIETHPNPEDQSRTVSDGSLLNRFRRGDDNAATELYLKYATRLAQLAQSKTSSHLQTRVDSDDIVQSVFRTFFRRAADGQYNIPEGDQVWRLLLVISLNKIRSLAAFHGADKRDSQKTIIGEGANSVLQTQAGTDTAALKALEMTIDEVLSMMPSNYREIVNLRIEGYGVSEISARTGRAKRSVERVLQEFREKLSRMFHES